MAQETPAKAASVSRNVIIDFKKGRSNPNRNNLAAIQHVLEEAGAEFIPENGGGEGVRRRNEA